MPAAAVVLLAATAALGLGLAGTALFGSRAVVRRLLRSRLTPLLLAASGCGFAAGLALIREPLPRVHDEFSYLLAADTFLHGRLANPPLPDERHFETLHVILSPTYASKYPPGQGLVIALGRALFGSPLAGVLLAFGTAVLAVQWMLRQWLGPRRALVGAALFALHPGLHGADASWSISFWGGALAAAGGALLLGAALRALRRPGPAAGCAAGGGLVLLALTRPFEGLVLTAVAAGMFARRRLPPGIGRALLPAAVVGLAGLAWLGYYNLRLTGHPLVMAYSLHEERYATAPLFRWQEPPIRPTAYPDRHLQAYWEKIAQDFVGNRTWKGGLEDAKRRISRLGGVLVGPAALAWCAALALFRRRVVRRAGIVCAAGLAATLLTSWSHPHYLAPFAGCGFALAAIGLLALTRLPPAAALPGRALAAGTLVLFAVGLGRVAVSRAAENPRKLWEHRRLELVRTLESRGPRHLVFVDYDERVPPGREWVYNGAALEGQPVIWARRLGEPADGGLLRSFPGREAWVLRAGRSVERLERYEPPP